MVMRRKHMKHQIGQPLYQVIALAMLAMSITACTSGMVEKPSQQIGVEAPITTSNASAENSEALSTEAPRVSNGNNITLTIIPESLHIKEICRTDRECEFRQKCGKLQFTLTNNSDKEIMITKIVRETLSPGGLIEETRIAPIPEEGLRLAAHQSLPMRRPECNCKRGDENCTTEYPHLTHPFLWHRTARITAYYISDESEEQKASNSANYVYFRGTR